MSEALIVLAIVVALAGGGLLAQVGALTLVWTGLSLVGAGMALGLPTGLLYHVLLYRALRSRGVVPERWWLRPTSLHDDIPDEQRGRVLFWCALGAAGFLVIVLGLVIGTVGLWRIC